MDLFPVLFFSSLVALLCYIITNQMQLGLYMNGVVMALLYIVLYWIVSLIWKPQEFIYCKSLVFSYLGRIKGLLLKDRV